MRRRLNAARVPGPVREVIRRLLHAGHQAFLVGGAVRDLVRGENIPAEDWDVATSARPEAVTGLFAKVVPTGIDHGTVTVVTEGGAVEVTTFRGEGEYSDRRRPDWVRYLDEIEGDLSRRDFTINAMAWNPETDDFRDPYGGLDDLASGTVRAVGDARARFDEDGLRPMRAVRFAAVLEFDLADATRKAIPGSRSGVAEVAAERLSTELQKLLLARRPSLGLDLMADTGLFRVVVPPLDGAPAGAFDHLDGLPRDLAARLAVLLSPLSANERAGVLEFLRLPTRVTTRALALAAEPPPEAAPADPQLRRTLARVGRDDGATLAAVWTALHPGTAPAAARLSALAASPAALSVSELALGGGEIMARLGVPPGPVIGQAQRYLLEQVLEAPERNTEERLGALLATWPGRP